MTACNAFYVRETSVLVFVFVYTYANPKLLSRAPARRFNLYILPSSVLGGAEPQRFNRLYPVTIDVLELCSHMDAVLK